VRSPHLAAGGRPGRVTVAAGRHRRTAVVGGAADWLTGVGIPLSRSLPSAAPLPYLTPLH